MLRDSPQTSDYIRHMRSKNTSVGVNLVYHDIFEVAKQIGPSGMVGQDSQVEHVRVGEHNIAHRLDKRPLFARGIAVICSRPNVGQTVQVDFTELILREGLRRKNI